MQERINARDFSGTGIKTPMETMRANAIIGAQDSLKGLSLINFNITTFLPLDRRDDALFILSQWAVEPIRLEIERFRKNPQSGEEAMMTRADFLLKHLAERQDVTPLFVEEARESMHVKIQTIMSYVTAPRRTQNA